MNLSFDKKKRKPLKTFKEVAAELGVTTRQLAGMSSAQHPKFPAPELIYADANWYNMSKINVWLKEREQNVQRKLCAAT